MAKHQDFTNANYQSITDFTDAVQFPVLVAANREYWDDFMKDRNDPAWYGADCKNGEAVIQVMRDGWSEGRDRLNELRSKIGDVHLMPIDRRRRPIWTDRGDFVDMTRVYSGRLDVAWRTARRQTTVAPPRIDICANMICSGYEHSDVLFWRGAAAATLADILEGAGYMVRMVVAFGGNAFGEKDQKTSCRIVVKDHGMPFDVTSTSAVILPGFFRALGHAWIANHCPYKRYGGGILVGEGIVEEGEIFISHDVRDRNTALAFVQAHIAKVNDRMAA